jgi:hypothetical protein
MSSEVETSRDVNLNGVAAERVRFLDSPRNDIRGSVQSADRSRRSSSRNQLIESLTDIRRAPQPPHCPSNRPEIS